MKLKLTTIAMASVIALSTSSAFAGYLTDSRGNVVVNSTGLCWDGMWANPDMIEQCGDKAMMADGDADMDGVKDSMDKCPGTPRGVAVDADGCPSDKDGDGVLDNDDKCPNTRAGAKVNADGCEIIGDVTINLVNDEFDFDSAVLKPDMKKALQGVLGQLKATPGDEHLDIIGHTDSMGPDAYNQGLSERRAQAVADYLQAFGVQPGNMAVSGKGESQPVADNGTKTGRSKNRRVEIMTK